MWNVEEFQDMLKEILDDEGGFSIRDVRFANDYCTEYIEIEYVNKNGFVKIRKFNKAAIE